MLYTPCINCMEQNTKRNVWEYIFGKSSRFRPNKTLSIYGKLVNFVMTAQYARRCMFAWRVWLCVEECLGILRNEEIFRMLRNIFKRNTHRMRKFTCFHNTQDYIRSVVLPSLCVSYTLHIGLRMAFDWTIKTRMRNWNTTVKLTVW